MTDFKTFASQLIYESLLYDEEFGAIGMLSLIDVEASHELYIAYFVPEDQVYTIEKATRWESDDQEDAEIGYTFASHTEPVLTSESAEEATQRLLDLIDAGNLRPSLAIVFEDE